LYNDDLHTLAVPYVPELNEFVARARYGLYNALRVEPGRIGLVINVSEVDASLSALPVDVLFERIFRLAGLNAQPSSSGLLTRQLVAQLGRLRGVAVYKIEMPRTIQPLGRRSS
jgi:hypothetical protein